MISVFELQLASDFLFASCPPVYTLPGTWTKCNAIIPHYNADPNQTFGISILVILVLLSGYGIYRAFFNNKDLQINGMIMMIELRNKLTLKECDFLIDVLMTDRSNQTGTIASVYKVDVPLLVQKLAGQGDMLEGIYNEFND